MASRAAAAWSSCLAGMMPGESRSSSGAWRSGVSRCRSHESCRVTPARFSVFATRRPASLLMIIDLPTLGNPTTAHRAARGLNPFATRFSLTTSAAWFSARSRPFHSPRPFLASIQKHFSVCNRRVASARHALRASGGARSENVYATTRGLCGPTHAATDGCAVVSGSRASRTSMTTSTSLSTFCSSRSALAMCPGYHWMLPAVRPRGSASSSTTMSSRVTTGGARSTSCW
mmetsp:Transcript_6468/g.27227  ORF Transcript_6468/g.27227 Transcript_6468/m.27227 type:complete len:231 (+) Transcript_6468:1407-2099(+)